jgi:hypothetical protein
MELRIQKYTKIEPGIVTINGQMIVKEDIQESLEKSLIQTYRTIGLTYLKFFKMDNMSKLAILAAEAILKDTSLYEIPDKNNIAVVLSNASSSLVTDANYQKTINNPENYFPSPSLFVYTLPNITIGEICIKHKIYGENVFLISKKFDAEILFFYVNGLFENTDTQHCITGWVECNETIYDAFFLLVEKGSGGLMFNTTMIDKLYKTK